MSSCTQLTLLSCSTRSLSYNQSLSSGRQSNISSLGRIKTNNGQQSSTVERNPLPLQQYRPFSISNLSATKSKKTGTTKSTLSNASTTFTLPKMSHNRLKQLKQVYSSNLYLFQCLAFIGFALLTIRLYEVNKDINYLRHVSNAWLPNITVAVPVLTPVAETLKVSSTVSMFSLSTSDKTPYASSLTASSSETEDDFDEEESEIKLTTVPYKFNNDSIESLPKPQSLQSSRSSTRSPAKFGLTSSTRSSGSSLSSNSSPQSSTSNSFSSTGSSSTSNTTPLSTQVDNIQREIDLAKAKSAYFHVENLRKDVDSLIGNFILEYFQTH